MDEEEIPLGPEAYVFFYCLPCVISCFFFFFGGGVLGFVSPLVFFLFVFFNGSLNTHGLLEFSVFFEIHPPTHPHHIYIHIHGEYRTYVVRRNMSMREKRVVEARVHNITYIA